MGPRNIDRVFDIFNLVRSSARIFGKRIPTNSLPFDSQSNMAMTTNDGCFNRDEPIYVKVDRVKPAMSGTIKSNQR